MVHQTRGGIKLSQPITQDGGLACALQGTILDSHMFGGCEQTLEHLLELYW